MKRRSFAAATGLLGLLIAACQQAAPSAEFTDQDAATLRALFDSTVVYARARNWTPWAAQNAEDAILQPPNAPTVRGRGAIQAWAEALPEMETFEFSDVQVSGAGDLAYGTSTYTLKPKGAPASDQGKQLVVFRRGTGGWEVVAVSFNSDLPVPGAPPPSSTTRD